MALFCSAGCEHTGPVCDFCVYYRFNGDSEGFYIDEGRCTHPAHPMPMRPDSECPDFHCAERPDAKPAEVQDHLASFRRETVPHIG